jgi:uncharacterized DUF497 family protein
MNLEFEWDAAKSEANTKKHGVTFEEALTVFANPLARIFDDPDHSADEHREIIIGHSVSQQLLIVSFTEREGKIRIISARSTTSREHQDYEENKQGSS